MQTIHGTLWKHKSGLTGSYWKKKYVYADEQKILHWQTEVKPENIKETLPKHGFVLFRCKITEEPRLRAYAFKIVDTVDNKTMIFAADNIAEFEHWMEILSLPHPDPKLSSHTQLSATEIYIDDDLDSHRSMEPSILDSVDDDVASTRDSLDIISSFFERNDVQESKTRYVNQRQLQQLLWELDPNLSSCTAEYVFNSLNITSGYISQTEFSNWWQAFEKDMQWSVFYSASFLIDSITPPPFKAMKTYATPPSIHFTGIVDVNQVKVLRPVVSSMLQLAVPPCPTVVTQWPANKSTDWNEGYQNCYDEAVSALHVSSTTATAAALATATATSAAAPRTLPRSQSQQSVLTTTSMASSAVPGTLISAARALTLNDEHEAAAGAGGEGGGVVNLNPVLQAGLSLASFYGDFVEKAVAGVKVIVDEFALPESLITACSLSVNDRKCASCQGQDPSTSSSSEDCSEMVFSHDGLVFRIVSHPVSEVDQPSKTTAGRELYLSRSDAASHKIAAAESRAQEAMQSAVAAVDANVLDLTRKLFQSATCRSADSKLKTYTKTLRTVVRNDRTFSFITKANSTAAGSSKLCKLRTLLSCVVDYGGFRVQVFCPVMDISPQKTLVKGLCDVNDKVVYYDRSAKVHSAILRATKVLNLSMSNILAPSVYSTPMTGEKHGVGDDEGVAQAEGNVVSVLSKELQAHKSSDGRVYVLNLQSILPCDLPRLGTTDSACRLLRPELVRAFSHPLSSLALKADVSSDDDFSTYDETATLDTYRSIEQQFRLKQQEINASAISQLYSTQLPVVAETLDSLSFIPLDSYSLTKFLHYRGVNCRHLGLLHGLCSTPFIRSTLTAEICARSCKTILNQLLRTQARAARAVSISAEHRQRSSDENFIEHQTTSLKARLKLVVGFFNVVFGGGPETEAFWSDGGPLYGVVLRNFGLKLSTHSRTGGLHLQTLLLAVQYHTGCLLHDKADYNLGQVETPSPFKSSDFLFCDSNSDFAVPVVKANLIIPGILDRCCSDSAALGEALLSSGLYADAVNVFRIRLSVYNLMTHKNGFKHSPPKHQSAVAHTTYKLALALHLSGEPEFNEEAAAILNSFLCNSSKYLTICGRMMSLLSSILLHLGRVSDAMVVFDAASDVYNCCLGTSHPILAVHMEGLADAYRLVLGKAAQKQARVMVSLAHQLAVNCLGETHLFSVGLATKLAVLCVEQGAYDEALKLLRVVIRVQDEVFKSFPQKQVASDLMSALYLKAIAQMEKREISKAIDTCNKILTVSTSTRSSFLNPPPSPPRHAPSSQLTSLHRFSDAASSSMTLGTAVGVSTDSSRVPIEEFAATVLMTDLLIRNKDLAGAGQLLHRTLHILKSNLVEDVNVGLAAARLTTKLLHLSLSSKPRQTHSFINTLVTEAVEAAGLAGDSTPRAAAAEEASPRGAGGSVDGGGRVRLSQADGWVEALEELVETMWTQPVDEVLEDLIRDAQASEQSLSTESTRSKKASKAAPGATSASSSPAIIRLALLLKLVRKW